jgi:hypothetical protein
MPTITPKLFAVAVLLLAAPSPCLALWEIFDVTPEEATKLGIVVQSKAAGPKDVRVEMQFKIDGALKEFDRVDLRVGEPNDYTATAALKEDRSKPDLVSVSFAAKVKQLDRISLWIMVPQSLGGVVYEVKIKDFVAVERDK